MTKAIHPVLRKSVRLCAAVGLVLGLAGFASPGLAAGGGGSGADVPINPPAAATPARPAGKPVARVTHKKTVLKVNVCHVGSVWSKKRNHCVKAVSDVLPAADLLEQGRRLALAGHFRQAIPVLDAISDKAHNPLAYTYLGYSHRKLGRTETGMDYYARALAIDPNSVNTHEYLGEAYVAVGKTEQAKVELAKVENLCGNRTCEQYTDLADALTGKSDE